MGVESDVTARAVPCQREGGDVWPRAAPRCHMAAPSIMQRMGVESDVIARTAPSQHDDGDEMLMIVPCWHMAALCIM